MASSRKKGEDFEKKVAAAIPGSKQTVNSGATFDDGDLTHINFVIECKVKDTKGISIPANLLKKVQKQAIKLGKDYLIVNKIIGGSFVTLRMETFKEFLDDGKLLRDIVIGGI